MDEGHNGFDSTSVKRFLGEAMRIHDKLDEAKIEHMNNCRDIREPLKGIETAARNAGLPLSAFRALVKAELAERNYKRAIEKARPKDEDDADAWDALREIAAEGKGDDLFAHAVARIDAEERDLRPRTLQEREAERIAKENAARIAAGISELDDGLGE
jgi:hypothetical protein